MYTLRSSPTEWFVLPLRVHPVHVKFSEGLFTQNFPKVCPLRVESEVRRINRYGDRNRNHHLFSSPGGSPHILYVNNVGHKNMYNSVS